jgi:hypothetical protein
MQPTVFMSVSMVSMEIIYSRNNVAELVLNTNFECDEYAAVN